MARPLGELARLVLADLEARGPVTARQLAHQLQMPVPVASRVLTRLEARGDATRVALVRVPHAKRPVGMYARVTPSAEAHSWALLQQWPPKRVS